jgi:hypothetical protein
MRKTILSLLSLFVIVCSSFAQPQANSGATDKLFKHDGQTLDVKIVKVSEFSVTYKFPGEDAEQLVGKLAVSKIVYASGRTEQISEKIDIGGKSDWEKVEIITDKAQVVGLKKGEEIR